MIFNNFRGATTAETPDLVRAELQRQMAKNREAAIRSQNIGQGIGAIGDYNTYYDKQGKSPIADALRRMQAPAQEATPSAYDAVSATASPDVLGQTVDAGLNPQAADAAGKFDTAMAADAVGAAADVPGYIPTGADATGVLDTASDVATAGDAATDVATGVAADTAGKGALDSLGGVGGALKLGAAAAEGDPAELAKAMLQQYLMSAGPYGWLGSMALNFV